MARKSTFATGGGYLNGVDAKITGYRFTDEFVDPNGVVYPYDPTKRVKGFKSGKMELLPHTINMVLSLRVDGAEEDVYQCLRIAADFDRWSIGETEQTLTPEADGARIGGSSAAAKFVSSWEVASNEGASGDDETVVDYTPIIGSRIRLVQQDLTAKELESIKKLGGAEKRKGKDGKAYTRQSLCVEQVYELGKPETKVNGRSKTPPINQAKPLGTKGGVPRQTTTSPSETVDIKEMAGAALVEIIKRVGKNGLLEKRKLSVQTLMTPLLKGKSYRDDVQKFLFDDGNLEEFATDGITVEDIVYDVTFDKVKQTIQVEAQ